MKRKLNDGGKPCVKCGTTKGLFRFITKDGLLCSRHANEYDRQAFERLSLYQQQPTPNENPDMWKLVLKDMEDRRQEGIRRYGTPLQPHNGRDALVDVYQELLDAAVYIRQAIYERDGK